MIGKGPRPKTHTVRNPKGFCVPEVIERLEKLGATLKGSTLTMPNNLGLSAQAQASFLYRNGYKIVHTKGQVL